MAATAADAILAPPACGSLEPAPRRLFQTQTRNARVSLSAVRPTRRSVTISYRCGWKMNLTRLALCQPLVRLRIALPFAAVHLGLLLTCGRLLQKTFSSSAVWYTRTGRGRE